MYIIVLDQKVQFEKLPILHKKTKQKLSIRTKIKNGNESEDILKVNKSRIIFHNTKVTLCDL